ncbi:MAG: TonB family protein [Rhizobiales bacterium]|nr:TonB family protein [Hyphomicrobiales bacterium]
MRRTLLALAALSTVLSAVPAQAKTVTLKASSPWNVDFGEERCRLTRLFTDGKDQHVLYFEQHFPSVQAGLTVAGRGFSHFENRTKTEVSTVPDRAALETLPYLGKMEGFDSALIYPALYIGRSETDTDLPSREGVLPTLDSAFGEKVNHISFRQRSREVRFDTGPLGKAFGVLNECATSLVDSWGLDGARHLTARSLPRWINEKQIVRKILANYPLAAANRGEQGITRMRVIVDEQGAVEDCTIIKATITENLESPACKAMRDARFEPAIDAEGKPMRSYFAANVTYQIGDSGT